MGWLISMALGWVARFFGMGAIAWFGRFLFVTFIAGLFLSAYNWVVDIFSEVCQITNSLTTQAYADSGMEVGAFAPVRFVGVGAYLAHHLRVIECFAFIFNIVGLKALLRLLPIRWMK